MEDVHVLLLYSVHISIHCWTQKQHEESRLHKINLRSLTEKEVRSRGTVGEIVSCYTVQLQTGGSKDTNYGEEEKKRKWDKMKNIGGREMIEKDERKDHGLSPGC